NKWQEFGLTPFGLYISSIFFVLFISIVFLIKNLKKNKIKLLITHNVEYSYKSIINISYPMLLSNSFALLMVWSDIIMLSFYTSTIEIGIYNSALKLALLSTIPLMAINSIAAPKFVEFYARRDFNGLKETVHRSTGMGFYSSGPILL